MGWLEPLASPIKSFAELGLRKRVAFRIGLKEPRDPLDEGAIAINHVRFKSVSLSESVRQTLMIEKAVKKFAEVQTTVSRIGQKIATDPMEPDMADTYVFLKPKSEWRSGLTKEQLSLICQKQWRNFQALSLPFLSQSSFE